VGGWEPTREREWEAGCCCVCLLGFQVSTLFSFVDFLTLYSFRQLGLRVEKDYRGWEAGPRSGKLGLGAQIHHLIK